MESNVRRRRRRKSDENDDEPRKLKSDADLEKEQSIRWWEIFVLLLVGVILIPIVILLLIPCPIDAQNLRMKELPALDGAFKPNDFLTKAEHVYVGQVVGPESLVFKDGTLYTGTSDGKVKSLKDGVAKTIAKFGSENCDSEETCGRPLGIRLHNDLLYVLDSYFGLYQVNPYTEKSSLLWPASASVNGKPSIFFNDLDISSDNKVYFTFSSTKWQRKDFAMIAMEGDRSGRLIEYDMYTNTTRELMTDLIFANGVQLSPEEDFLLVCETLDERIWKYHLKGPKRGTSEILIDNLPGIPDNIRRSSTGGYWIGLSTVKHKDAFSLLHFMADKPWLRNQISKLGSKLITAFLPKYGLIIEIDGSGQIKRSLHDPSGKVVYSASEVEDTGSVLYIGSYNQPYVSKLDV